MVCLVEERALFSHGFWRCANPHSMRVFAFDFCQPFFHYGFCRPKGASEAMSMSSTEAGSRVPTRAIFVSPRPSALPAWPGVAWPGYLAALGSGRLKGQGKSLSNAARSRRRRAAACLAIAALLNDPPGLLV
jgi:hypothetical protein